MNEIVARYEFRVFAPSLAMIAENLRQMTSCERIEESCEAYLVSADLHDHNVKVRDGAVNIKRLVALRDGLEQWKPAVRQRFPISSDFVAATLIPIFSSLKSDCPASREEYTAEELIDEFFQPQAGVCVASVFKRRFRFTLKTNCSTENERSPCSNRHVPFTVNSLFRGRTSHVRSVSSVKRSRRWAFIGSAAASLLPSFSLGPSCHDRAARD